MERARKNIRKGAIQQLIIFLSDYTFDEIITVVPKALDYFSDEEIDVLLAEIQKCRRR